MAYSGEDVPEKVDHSNDWFFELWEGEADTEDA